MSAILFVIIVVFFAYPCCDGQKSHRACDLFSPSVAAAADNLHLQCPSPIGFPEDSLSGSTAPLEAREGSNLLQVRSKRSSKLPSVAVGGDIKQPQPTLKPVAPTFQPQTTPAMLRYLSSRATAARVAVERLLKPWQIAGVLFLLALLIVACLLLAVQAEEKRSGATSRQHHSPVISSRPTLPPTSASSSPLLGRSLFKASTPPRPQTIPPERTLSPATPKASVARMDAVASRHLCPGLVVPHGNECHLALPVLNTPRDGSTGAVAFDVKDLNGNCVVTAELVLPQLGSSGFDMADKPLFTLWGTSRRNVARGGDGQRLLAYCRTMIGPGDGRKQVCIYDARDALFAMVVKDPADGRCVVSSGRTSLRLYIEPDKAPNRQQSLRLYNDQRQLLAETSREPMSFNPSGSYYKLRVGSDMDVGLVLCALFSVQCSSELA